MSDDTNHDSIMTMHIIEDNIKQHPELIADGVLILRSDNCSTQYKSRYVFKAMLDLAKKYGIRIIWFFGEAGHGRGLIDAMAWFGAKGPMRNHILQTDRWFENAEAMCSFLKLRFSKDKAKFYNYMDFRMLAEIRRLGREERPVEGCQAARVMMYSPDGNSVRKWGSIKAYLEEESDVEETVADEGGIEEEDVAEEEEPQWEENLETTDIFDDIKIDSYVAIKSQDRGQNFYIMKILEKGIAKENIIDTSKEHSVLRGEPYLKGMWISFINESKKVATFKESTKSTDALLHIGEIIQTNVDLTEKKEQKGGRIMEMKIEDYRMLQCYM